MESLIKNKYFLFFLIVGLILLYIYFISYPNAKIARDELQAEYEMITTLPEAKKVNIINHVKYTQANVGARYYTSLNQKLILEHYHEELNRLGWEYYSTKPYRHRGVQMEEEGKVVLYKKGRFSLTITHIGGDPTHDYTYSINLEW